jgi:hypothetical protein
VWLPAGEHVGEAGYDLPHDCIDGCEQPIELLVLKRGFRFTVAAEFPYRIIFEQVNPVRLPRALLLFSEFRLLSAAQNKQPCMGCCKFNTMLDIVLFEIYMVDTAVVEPKFDFGSVGTTEDVSLRGLIENPAGHRIIFGTGCTSTG